MKILESVWVLLWISTLRRDREHYIKVRFAFLRQGSHLAASRCTTAIRGMNDRLSRARKTHILLTWGAAA